MIIDLIDLRRRGAQKSPFSFTFDPDQRLMSLPDGAFERATIEGEVEVYDDRAFLAGRLTFGINAKCSRCLKDAHTTITVEFDEEFRPAPCEETDVNVYERDRIDVSAFAEQLILTNMPYTVYCKEDCSGLCPECGKDLNDGDCGCNGK